MEDRSYVSQQNNVDADYLSQTLIWNLILEFLLDLIRFYNFIFSCLLVVIFCLSFVFLMNSHFYRKQNSIEDEILLQQFLPVSHSREWSDPAFLSQLAQWSSMLQMLSPESGLGEEMHRAVTGKREQTGLQLNMFRRLW